MNNNNNDNSTDMLETKCNSVSSYVEDDYDNCSCGFAEEANVFPDNPMLGQSYVPIQYMDKTFKPCIGLKMGTIFPELVSTNGRPLRFDFAVFDDNNDLDFLIEYQGVQHYEPKSKFGGLSGLRKQQYNDMKKREFCAKHGITLIAIPYWDEGRVNYDYIMKAAGY